MKIFESTVNCWFCNAESKVSIFKKNSWTCNQCDQYNGFDKHGDYNRSMNEMYDDKSNQNVKYCVNNGTTVTNSGSSNKLCDKCNTNQERKIQELAKFEPKNEKFFEIEYKAEVEKLDQIYGLCIKCQRAVDQHKTNIDRQVGQYNEGLLNNNNNNNNKRKQIVTKQSTLLKPLNNITNKIDKNPLVATKLTNIKAHTIAGTVPPYKPINKTSDFNNYHHQPQQQSPISPPPQTTHRSRAMLNRYKESPTRNQSSAYYTMIIGDTLITLALIFTFVSDLAHLFHDSGYHKLNNSNILLIIYSNLKYLLPTCTFISLFIMILRFKFSKVLFFLCVCLCTLVHLHVYELEQREEHIVLELFVSFCVCLLSLIKIFYYISHFIVYCQQKPSPSGRQQKINGCLNDQSLMNDDKFDESLQQQHQSPIATTTNRYSNGTIKNGGIRDSRSPPATPTTSASNNNNKNDTLLESPMQVDTSMNDSENTKPILFTQQQQQQHMQLRSRLPQPKVFYTNRK